MRDDLPSLTAGTVAFVTALRWYQGHKLGILQAELMRNLHQRYMPLPLWMLMQICLSFQFAAMIFLSFFQMIMGKAEVFDGVWMRKVYMEAQVVQFLETHEREGKDVRVIILAAGYDLLAFRLAKQYPNVQFIEIDHPATGEAKLSALRNLMEQQRENNRKSESTPLNSKDTESDAIGLPINLIFCHDKVGEDGCTIRQALEKNGLKVRDTEIPTAVVMEGLSPYLTEKENKSIFREMGVLFGCNGSIIAFDFFYLDEYCRPSNPNLKKVSSWVASFMKLKVELFGEPFKWGISPENLPSWFEGTGWEPIPSIETFQNYGANHPKYATMMGMEYESTVKWVGRKSVHSAILRHHD